MFSGNKPSSAAYTIIMQQFLLKCLKQITNIKAKV